MGKTTGISWATSTFNLWWGCVEVGGSPACGGGEFGDECYAKTWDHRMGGNHWGSDAERRFFGDKHWNQPVEWNRKAEKSGQRWRVFCMSMGDWAEGRPDQKASLERLWPLIKATPHLDWLMLTKRPQLITSLYPQEWQRNPQPNVWMGATCENQFWTDNRWEFLKRIDTAVYWFSMEPLFEAVKLPTDFLALGKRAWVIVGGQSGRIAHPLHPDWARSVRDQCLSAGVPFHFKQWGEWAPMDYSDAACYPQTVRWTDEGWKHGEAQASSTNLARIGNRAAGHLLDGREWLQFPVPRSL
jgi:protein gp37